jgi:hypothetical protein
MAFKENLLLLAGGLIPGAIAFWINAYNDYNVLGIDQRLVLAAATLLVAFIARLLTKKQTLTVATYIAAGVVLAFLLRVTYDTTFIDKSHHNLLPFSLFLYSIISFPAAFLGSLMAQLVTGRNKSK